MQEYIGELIGTMILVMFGSGVGASINLNEAFAKGKSNWNMVAFGWGFAVMLGVYAAGVFGAPGHLNPALTIAFALGGVIEWNVVLGYCIAQMIGAFLGATFTIVHYWTHFKATQPDEGNVVGIFATGPAIPNVGFNLLSEIMATFAFTFALLLLGADFTDGLKPLIVGFLIAAIGFSFGSTTGYAINPARDLGPRMAYAFLPVPNKGGANWSYAWIPIVGPIIGAIIAVFVSQAIV